MTFVEAGFVADDLREEAPPPLVRPKVTAVPEPVVVDGAEARRIDAALMTFAARERLLRATTSRGAAFPPEAAQAWSRVFSEVDQFLMVPATATPPLELTRTFVTLDAELDLDGLAYAGIPPEIGGGSKERQARARERMAEVHRMSVKRVADAMTWPIAPPLITSLYGERVDPITGEWEKHLGVDISAQSGQLVTAAADGIVSMAHWQGGHGLHVEVDHLSNFVTRYSHLSVVLTTPGTQVNRGDPIGLAGNTGRSTGPHLHFEVWKEGRPVDPLTLLGDPSLIPSSDPSHAREQRAPARSARRPPRHKAPPPAIPPA